MSVLRTPRTGSVLYACAAGAAGAEEVAPIPVAASHAHRPELYRRGREESDAQKRTPLALFWGLLGAAASAFCPSMHQEAHLSLLLLPALASVVLTHSLCSQDARGQGATEHQVHVCDDAITVGTGYLVCVAGQSRVVTGTFRNPISCECTL